MSPIRVFLVDDHSVLRQGLRLLIDAEPDMRVVGESDRAHGAAEQAVGAGADVVVLDVSMPDANGRIVAERLREIRPETRVVALTRHTERAYLQQMMSSGAAGYVLKQTPAETLLEAIRAAAAGTTFVDPALTATPTATRSPMGGELTRRERDVATMVARGHTNKEIAEVLGISVKTVETHKTNIMRKLGLSSRAELVRFAVVEGWLES